MSDPKASFVALIRQFLIQHPELAPTVERIAARQQGRSEEDFLNFAEWKRYQGLSTKEIFEKIYDEGHWGKGQQPGVRYFSGTGSHDPAMVNAYVGAVGAFLQGLPEKPSALDIGCGDFNVGSKLRPYCGAYTGADIVSQVIEDNKTRYSDAYVNFVVLNIIEEKPPYADVIFLRQVLQHLSNNEIRSALRNLAGQCKHLIVTEHLPPADFTPNIDKTTGRGIRIRHNSGVVLSEAPFSLAFREERTICEVPELGGIVRTTIYSL
jgi:SAM-dependent methyltransferase